MKERFLRPSEIPLPGEFTPGDVIRYAYGREIERGLVLSAYRAENPELVGYVFVRVLEPESSTAREFSAVNFADRFYVVFMKWIVSVLTPDLHTGFGA